MPTTLRIGRGKALALASLLVAATSIYAAGWIWYSGSAPSARFGFGFDHSRQEAALIVTEVAEGSPAAAAGLEPGDRITAIDGRSLATLAPLYDSILRGRPGTPIVLRVTRGARTMVIEGRLGPPVLTPPSSLRLVAGELLRLYPILFLAVIVVLLLQRPQDRNAWLVSLLFASFIAAAPLDPSYVHPWIRRFALAYATVFRTLIPALFFALFALFPARSPVDARLPALKYALALVALATSVPLAVLVGSAGTWDPLEALSERIGTPTLEVALAAYALIGFGGGAASLLWSYFAAPLQARRRSGVIVWGTVVAITPMLLLQLVARGSGVYDYPFWIWAPAVFALFLLPLSFAYAVVRHRVIEIPLLLKRSARYLLVQRGSIVLVSALGLAASVALALVFPRVAPHRPELAVPAGLLVGVAFGVALAWSGTQVHRGLASRIDRAFFRSAYDARRILEDLAVAAARTTSRQELADLLRNCLDDALRPAFVVVHMQDGELLRPVSGRGAGAVDPLDPSLQELARDPEPLVIDVHEGERHPLPLIAPLGPECVVPMIGRSGTVTGLLALGPRLSDEPYSSEDRRLLASVCRQAGLALDSIILAEQMARRLESERRAAQELAIAQQVQARLLPQDVPTMRTLELRGSCLQARAVGGDFYDFFDLGDGCQAVVLADISGKGISAALLMANLQAHLRAHYLSARNDPAALLAAVDRYMFDATAANHYATLFFGRYDDTSRRLTYVNCGHNPPLLLRGSRDPEWLPPTAPAVGLLPSWACTVGEISLGPADTLVIYSDGVTEAMADDGEPFGEDRLLDLATRSVDLSIDRFVAHLMQEVQTFTGSVQEDDLTLVVARGR